MPSIFEQFPLSCTAIQDMPKVKRARITAAKAYLRTAMGAAAGYLLGARRAQHPGS